MISTQRVERETASSVPLYEEHEPSGRPSAAPRYRRIAVVHDGSPASDRALAAAVELALRDNAAMGILGVASQVPLTVGLAYSVSPADIATESLDALVTLVHERVSRLPFDLSVTSEVRLGKPAAEICRFAASNHYDILFLGVGSHRFRLEAVSPRVCKRVLNRVTLEVRVIGDRKC